MNFFTTLLIIMASVSCSFSTADDNSHSSFLHIVEDYYLADHVSHRQKVSSVLSCAQLCLRSRPLCRSLNYGSREGTMVCELNDKGVDIAETPDSSLVPMSGFIFGQLLLTVSKTTNHASNRLISELVIEGVSRYCLID